LLNGEDEGFRKTCLAEIQAARSKVLLAFQHNSTELNAIARDAADDSRRFTDLQALLNEVDRLVNEMSTKLHDHKYRCSSTLVKKQTRPGNPHCWLRRSHFISAWRLNATSDCSRD